MAASVFIGRESELERLDELYKEKVPSLTVVKGRRRVGKSRLINRFASRHASARLWDFSALAPQGGMDDQSQRDHFARQLAALLESPSFMWVRTSRGFNQLNPPAS